MTGGGSVGCDDRWPSRSLPVPPRRGGVSAAAATSLAASGVGAVALLLVAGLVWGADGAARGRGRAVAPRAARRTTSTAPASPTPRRRPPPSTAPATTAPTTPTSTTAAPRRRRCRHGSAVGGRTRPGCSWSATATPGRSGRTSKELLDDTGVVETTVDYKVSSGLARPDFFDWPAHLRGELPAVDPDIVVVTFGGNDAQGLAAGRRLVPQRRPGRGRGRVAARVHPPGRRGDGPAGRRRAHGDLGGDPQRRQPRGHGPAGGPGRGRAGRRRRPPRRACSSTRGPGSPAATAAGPSTSSTPATTTGKDVRADDGFHLNENGAEILALDIADVVTHRPPSPRRRPLSARVVGPQRSRSTEGADEGAQRRQPAGGVGP